MKRSDFIKIMGATTIGLGTSNVKSWANSIAGLPELEVTLPVVFTSHGNPMDIPLPHNANPFLTYLFDLGVDLRKKYSTEIKAILVVSAHWCTKGTYVNISPWPETIYDFYGFPPEYYTIKYPAPGAPEFAQNIAEIIPAIRTTNEWGFDHGNWPMLRHLFPDANLPIFQMSIDYYQSPQYHYELAVQLKMLRKKGVLIIGSGSVVHNLQLASSRLFKGDKTLYGWDKEFDDWIKQRVDDRDIKSLMNYEKTKLGKMAAPTPDHYVPLIYSMAMLNTNDTIKHTCESLLPAFSDRSFIIGSTH